MNLINIILRILCINVTLKKIKKNGVCYIGINFRTCKHREPEQYCVTKVGAQTDHNEQSTEACWCLKYARVLVGQQEVHQAADKSYSDVEEVDPLHYTATTWCGDGADDSVLNVGANCSSNS